MAKQRPHRPREEDTPLTAERSVDVVVSVIVLHFGTLELTTDCVKSVLKQAGAPSFEVIIVDNCSPDGSGATLARRFKGQAKVVKTKRNLGFGPGNTFGARAARGQYLFFINSDTLLPPDCLAVMAAAADSQPEFGLLTPTVRLKGRSRTVQPASFGRFATVWRMLVRAVDLPATHLEQYDEIAPVDWVTGAAMWLPADVFWSVGGFDHRYFMYWEDQDLCRAVQAAGWRVGVVLDADIVHLGGRSQKLPRSRLALYDQSQKQFILKHQGLVALGVFLVLAWPWKLLRNARAH